MPVISCDMQALLASPSGEAHLEDYCRSMAGFYSGDSAVPMPYSVATVFVGCATLAARGSGTQRAALMRASVYQLAVATSTELAPMDPRLATADGGVGGGAHNRTILSSLVCCDHM